MNHITDEKLKDILKEHGVLYLSGCHIEYSTQTTKIIKAMRAAIDHAKQESKRWTKYGDPKRNG